MVAQHCTLFVRQGGTNVSTPAYTIFFLVHNFLPLDTNNLKFLTRCKDASILIWQRCVTVTKVTKVESYFYNCQRHVTQGPPSRAPVRETETPNQVFVLRLVDLVINTYKTTSQLRPTLLLLLPQESSFAGADPVVGGGGATSPPPLLRDPQT